MAKNGGHGGRRTGAGRPKVGEKTISFRVSDDMDEWINAKRGDREVSEFMRNLMETLRTLDSEINNNQT